MKDLLEHLAYKTGCMHISDLPRCRQGLLGAVWSIPEETYSVEEWRKTVDYIYNTEMRFETVRDAKKFILSCHNDEMQDEKEK